MGHALILHIWVGRGFVGGATAFAGTGVSLAEDGGAGFAAVAWAAWVLRERAGVIQSVLGCHLETEAVRIIRSLSLPSGQWVACDPVRVVESVLVR